MTIVQLDPANGLPMWHISAGGVQFDPLCANSRLFNTCAERFRAGLAIGKSLIIQSQSGRSTVLDSHNMYTTDRRPTIALHAENAQPVRCMYLNLRSNANSNPTLSDNSFIINKLE